ncbi:MAG: peptidylprolyl isomerase [Algoriphagus sp.]|nr:peptidylprolyl isomerase [Algoriphagus sp.]
MNHRILSAIFTLLFLSSTGYFSLSAHAQEQTDVLFTVGNKSVEKEQFLYLITKGKKVDPAAATLSREEFEENFDQFLLFQLKVAEAESLGLHQSEEFNREFESFKESLIAPFLIKNGVEEGELRKVYGRMQEIVRASHILFQLPPNASNQDSLSMLKLALKVKAELENGADFNALALEYSDDPSAKMNKGDLGYFTGLQMVQQFEEAAYLLPVGSISDPVVSDFGYHIIQVKDRQANPGEVQVSHILVRFDAENSSQEENARRRISDIYAEIQKENTRWEEIVKFYSEDAATKEGGGILPWFGVGTMIPEFEMAALSLTEVGEISPPLKTPYGYHILRLEGKRPLQSYEELEQTIKSKILRNSKSGMIQSQVIAMQKARYGFKENEAELVRVTESLTSEELTAFGAEVLEKGLTEVQLFSIHTNSFAVGDLWKFMQAEEVTPKGSGTFFTRWLDKFVAYTLAQTEEKDLEETNSDYQKLLKEYRDGILMFSLTNQEVWQKGLNDSIGQLAYYTTNIQNYQWRTRVQAYLVKVNDASKLDDARKYLQNKGFNSTSFASFEANYRANFPNAYATESGTFEYESHPILSKVDLNQAYQELVVEGVPYVLVVGNIYPPGPRKFEEARGLVIRDYQAYLDQALTKRLKEKYPIQINSGVKEKAFAALNN